MSIQFTEILVLRGEKLPLCSLPLEQYSYSLDSKPSLRRNTALERGYIGEWEICDDMLYLVGIDGWFDDGSSLFVLHVFPDSEGAVFAEWFTGTLRIPQGKRLNLVLFGFDTVYESDRFISVSNGKVESEWVVTNDVPPVDERNQSDIPDFLKMQKS